MQKVQFNRLGGFPSIDWTYENPYLREFASSLNRVSVSLSTHTAASGKFTAALSGLNNKVRGLICGFEYGREQASETAGFHLSLFCQLWI